MKDPWLYFIGDRWCASDLHIRVAASRLRRVVLDKSKFSRQVVLHVRPVLEYNKSQEKS